MRKEKERKKEKEQFRKLHEIMDKLDSYEEIYPDREIEENLYMNEKQTVILKSIAEYFFNTDLMTYINDLLETEEKMKEYGKLSEYDISSALNIRDTLYLMSEVETASENELSISDQVPEFYKKRKNSLLSALKNNNHTICFTDNHKKKRQAEREGEKIKIYLDLLTSNLKSSMCFVIKKEKE